MKYIVTMQVMVPAKQNTTTENIGNTSSNEERTDTDMSHQMM